MATCSMRCSDHAWQHEPLVIHVYDGRRAKPSFCLRLAPVFFNPVCHPNLSSGAIPQKTKNRTSEAETSTAIVKPRRPRASTTSRERDQLELKRKRVVSAYMDQHKISSLLRTFEILSCHQTRDSGTPVTIGWRYGEDPGERQCNYVGIVSEKGDIQISQKWPIGMVRIAVDRVQNVAMLRSSTLDSYLTGHIDNGIVDGKADSSDVTACHWRVVPCSEVFQSLTTSERDGVILQHWSKKHCKDQIHNGLFFIITREKEFRLEEFSLVRNYGVFTLRA